MQGTFTQIIQDSFEWTKTILFKPFQLKKWIFLYLMALLSTEFSGCNLNLPVQKQLHLPTISPLTISIFLIFFTAIVILFIWLHSRFSFIFINSIVKNDPSIKAPFRENKDIGNSFFRWNIFLIVSTVIITSLIVLILLGGVSFWGKLLIGWKIILTILWLLSFICALTCILIVYVIVNDFVLPVMFKEKKYILQGWKDVLILIKNEKLNFTKYLLIKLGLRIVTGIGAGLFTILVMFALLIQIGIIGGLLYSISFALPGFIKFGYYILLIVLGVIALLSIIFLVNLMLLPIPIFFRTYSLKFLASIDNRYNLFNIKEVGYE